MDIKQLMRGSRPRKITTIIVTFTILSLALPHLAEAAKSKKTKISDSGMANDFVYDLAGGHPVKRKNYFSPENKKATWWCKFPPFSIMNKPKLKARWYKPDGMLYKEDDFTTPWACLLYAKTNLPVKDSIPAEDMGRWRVEIFWDEEKIDEQSFFIGSDKSTAMRGTNTGTDELTNRIITQPIDPEQAANILNCRLKAGDGNVYCIRGEDNIFYISDESEKIYWKCKFIPFFGVSSPQVKTYWISPDRIIYALNATSFLPTNEASFYVKTKDISTVTRGEWRVISCIDDVKASEQRFILEDKEAFNRQFAKRIDERVELRETALPAQTYKFKTVHQVKKGETEREIKAKWGEPNRIIQITENKALWIYWAKGSGDDTVQAYHIVQGDIVGALFTGLFVQAFDEMLEIGKAFGVYFVNGKIKEVRLKKSVTKKKVFELTPGDFQERFFGIPVEKELTTELVASKTAKAEASPEVKSKKQLKTIAKKDGRKIVPTSGTNVYDIEIPLILDE